MDVAVAHRGARAPQRAVGQIACAEVAGGVITLTFAASSSVVTARLAVCKGCTSGNGAGIRMRRGWWHALCLLI
jgi:hypothetical protein